MGEPNLYIAAIEIRLAGLRKGLGEIQDERTRLSNDALATQGAIQILEDLLSAVITLTPPETEQQPAEG